MASPQESTNFRAGEGGMITLRPAQPQGLPSPRGGLPGLPTGFRAIQGLGLLLREIGRGVNFRHGSRDRRGTLS